MTLLDASAAAPAATPPPAFTAAPATMRMLARISAIQAVALGAAMACAVFATLDPGRVPVLAVLMRQGLAGIVGGALSISLAGGLCCAMLTWGRRRMLRPEPDRIVAPPRHRVFRMVQRYLPAQRRRPRKAITWVAGWPQGLLIIIGVSASVWLVQRFPPLPPDDAAVTAADWPGIAALTLLPAFLLIVGERMVASVSAEHLPETSRLAALLRLPIAVLLAFAAFAAARGFGIAVPPEAFRVLAVPVLAVDAELAVRALGPWFLPPPEPDRARAAIGSVLASLLQPGTFKRLEIARGLRDRFGIDMSRSWAVGYARAAATPVLLFLMLLSWGLTGVVRIGLDQRGSYERFGAPVAILHPGLHIVLPWPFGTVRPIEYGTVHAISIGDESQGRGTPADLSTADGAPSAAINRLWDQQTGRDVSYIIASHSGARQSFETVTVDVRVLYRIGMDDASARRALYGVGDPVPLVRALSGRLLAQFLAARTLPQVLGERRERIADQLQRDLQTELDQRQCGLQVVALVVEALHPPGGAAVAYRGVQAAQIVASTRRAEELGRAYGTLGAAARDARDAEDAAQGTAAELVGAAKADQTQTDADLVAYRNGGQAFALERYFASLRTALGRAALEIVDHRLSRQQQPMIDLRAPLSTTSRNGAE